MIQTIKLLHYLSENTYKSICAKLNLNPNISKNNMVIFPNEKISKIELYHIDYKEFGHIWFMDMTIDFPKFSCDYSNFEHELYAQYNVIFDENIMSDFPKYNDLCCDYIEYSALLELSDNSFELINNLKEKCVPEQLDKSLWNQYKKPHGTIEFCISINENTLETLARCHGTALKKRITDVSLHRTVGLIPQAAINKDTEISIMNWLYKRYRINHK